MRALPAGWRYVDHPTYYRIEETACWPCSFKIVPTGNWRQDNSWTEFFRTREEAVAEIARRGAEPIP